MTRQNKHSVTLPEYQALIQALKEHYGSKLKTVVLFGSQARGEAHADSDHDIFLLVNDLPDDPLMRQRDVRCVLLPILSQLPGSISFVAKTPQEISQNLTPLLLDICVDGIVLFGKVFFDTYRQRALAALQQSGLKRHRVAGAWMWSFPQMTDSIWELNWDGYHANR